MEPPETVNGIIMGASSGNVCTTYRALVGRGAVGAIAPPTF